MGLYGLLLLRLRRRKGLPPCRSAAIIVSVDHDQQEIHGVLEIAHETYAACMPMLGASNRVLNH